MKKSQKNTTCPPMMNCPFSFHNRTRSSCIVSILFEDLLEFRRVIPPSQIVIAPINRGIPMVLQDNDKCQRKILNYISSISNV